MYVDIKVNGVNWNKVTFHQTGKSFKIGCLDNSDRKLLAEELKEAARKIEEFLR